MPNQATMENSKGLKRCVTRIGSAASGRITKKSSGANHQAEGARPVTSNIEPRIKTKPTSRIRSSCSFIVSSAPVK